MSTVQIILLVAFISDPLVTTVTASNTTNNVGTVYSNSTYRMFELTTLQESSAYSSEDLNFGLSATSPMTTIAIVLLTSALSVSNSQTTNTRFDITGTYARASSVFSLSPVARISSTQVTKTSFKTLLSSASSNSGSSTSSSSDIDPSWVSISSSSLNSSSFVPSSIPSPVSISSTSSSSVSSTSSSSVLSTSSSSVLSTSSSSVSSTSSSSVLSNSSSSYVKQSSVSISSSSRHSSSSVSSSKSSPVSVSGTSSSSVPSTSSSSYVKQSSVSISSSSRDSSSSVSSSKSSPVSVSRTSSNSVLSTTSGSVLSNSSSYYINPRSISISSSSRALSSYISSSKSSQVSVSRTNSSSVSSTGSSSAVFTSAVPNSLDISAMPRPTSPSTRILSSGITLRYNNSFMTKLHPSTVDKSSFSAVILTSSMTLKATTLDSSEAENWSSISTFITKTPSTHFMSMLITAPGSQISSVGSTSASIIITKSTSVNISGNGQGSKGKKLSEMHIIYISAGSVAGLLAMIIVFCLVCRKKRKRKRNKKRGSREEQEMAHFEDEDKIDWCLKWSTMRDENMFSKRPRKLYGLYGENNDGFLNDAADLRDKILDISSNGDASRTGKDNNENENTLPRCRTFSDSRVLRENSSTSLIDVIKKSRESKTEDDIFTIKNEDGKTRNDSVDKDTENENLDKTVVGITSFKGRSFVANGSIGDLVLVDDVPQNGGEDNMHLDDVFAEQNQATGISFNEGHQVSEFTC